jgi:hypothetical protein
MSGLGSGVSAHIPAVSAYQPAAGGWWYGEVWPEEPWDTWYQEAGGDSSRLGEIPHACDEDANLEHEQEGMSTFAVKPQGSGPTFPQEEQNEVHQIMIDSSSQSTGYVPESAVDDSERALFEDIQNRENATYGEKVED